MPYILYVRISSKQFTRRKPIRFGTSIAKCIWDGTVEKLREVDQRKGKRKHYTKLTAIRAGHGADYFYWIQNGFGFKINFAN